MGDEGVVICSACGTPARPGARFCARCGASLTVAPPAVAAPADEAPTVPRDPPPPDPASAPTVAFKRPRASEAVTLTGMQAIQQRALRQVSGTATHVGRVRHNNEDFVAKLDYSLDQSGAAEPTGLYIVADGMGGYAEGEKASRDSVRQAFRDFIEGHLLHDLNTPTRSLHPQDEPTPLDATLRTLVEEANRLVYSKRREKGAKHGTTIVALLIIGARAAVANVGDSRAYLLRDGALRQISEDHSFVYGLYKAGQISEEQIYTHPQKNEIFRSLGAEENVQVDVYALDVRAGDRLLLCSDGLWEMVRNAQIASILTNAPTPQLACDRLVAAAYDNGGADNISAIVVHME